MESIEQKIERFQLNYSKLLKNIEDLEDRSQNTVLKFTLYCVFIDTLSKSLYGNTSGNKLRFISFLDNCDIWPNRNKISLIHLFEALKNDVNHSDRFLKLYSWCSNLIGHSFPSEALLMQRSPGQDLSVDPDISAVQKYWPLNSNGTNLKINDLKIEDFQHANLFWKFRNLLVHELRYPGIILPLQSENVSYPFYSYFSDLVIDNIDNYYPAKWELYYPIGFISKLCNEALDRTCMILSEKKTCPFSAYSEGSYWIQSLNKKSQ